MPEVSNKNVTGGQGDSGRPGKRSKLRWAVWGVGGLLGAGAVLVLLTPTLLSTGAGKAIVMGQVNKNLNGRVEVGSWWLAAPGRPVHSREMSVPWGSGCFPAWRRGLWVVEGGLGRQPLLGRSWASCAWA